MNCLVCGKRAYSEYCVTHKPRKPIQTKRPIRQLKPNAWMKTRAKWFAAHPAEWYLCHYCGRMLTKVETTLDHKISRSSAPHLKHDFDNLVPCCWPCNGLKGSISHDMYAHTCYEM